MAPKPAADDPIRHVVVLALENHSFDQMLGCFKQLYPDLEGVDPAAPRENADDRGTIYRQAPTTERQMLLDPHHEVDHVAVQLANGNAGFVRDFVASYPSSTPAARQLIMGYYPLDFLPALHRLARDFAICDHWFASLPGPTWPNRFFALTGTSMGRVNMPEDGEHTVDLAGWVQQKQDTIFDRLTERGIHWKIYFHDCPQSWVLEHQRLPHNAARYFYVDEFFDDARGDEEDFPQLCFIEPDFMGFTENDAHPPHDIMKAEKLIADVYNSLRANLALWRSTLLVVFYDEHGGFYDHVIPPAATPPDEHHEEYAFDQLGVRVPALLISPWVDRRVESTQFDHTSLLKYLTEKWELGALGHRVATANSLGAALGRQAPREDSDSIRRIELTTEQLAPPDLNREEKGAATDTAHQRALQRLIIYLKSEADEDVPGLDARLARCIEWARAWLSREDAAPLRASIAEPDKLTRRHGTARDGVAHFLMNRKTRSVPELARWIRDPNRPREIREHAVQTLAMISRRPFHRAPDKIAQATLWLDQIGQLRRHTQAKGS
jgi:phospholipase C